MNLQNKPRYISYSEMYCFYEYGKDEYYKRYILGIQESPTEPLIFGSIVHELLANPKYNWREEIKKLMREPQDTYIRIIEKIIATVPCCERHEVKLFIKQPEFCLFAGIDGVDNKINKDVNFLTEYKTGQAIWIKERVNESEQITMYTLCWFLETGNLLPYNLISISSKNGKSSEFKIHRTKSQIDEFYKKLLQFKKDLLELGFWDKKVKFNDRIKL